MVLPASVARVALVMEHIRRCDGAMDPVHAYEVVVVAQDAVEAAFGNVLDPADAWAPAESGA